MSLLLICRTLPVPFQQYVVLAKSLVTFFHGTYCAKSYFYFCCLKTFWLLKSYVRNVEKKKCLKFLLPWLLKEMVLLTAVGPELDCWRLLCQHIILGISGTTCLKEKDTTDRQCFLFISPQRSFFLDPLANSYPFRRLQTREMVRFLLFHESIATQRWETANTLLREELQLCFCGVRWELL